MKRAILDKYNFDCVADLLRVKCLFAEISTEKSLDLIYDPDIYYLYI